MDGYARGWGDQRKDGTRVQQKPQRPQRKRSEALEMEVEFKDDFEDRGIIFDDAKVINEAKKTQENTMERSFRKDARFPSVIEKHIEGM